MPRKQKGSGGTVATAETDIHTVSATNSERRAYIDGPPVDDRGAIIKAELPAEQSLPASAGTAEGQERQWGPPYKAIFTSSKDFEMGENRRFKQRVFKFWEKPDSETIATLKDNGFTYRPEEKAWTIPANEATRQITDRLARDFAGEAPEISR